MKQHKNELFTKNHKMVGFAANRLKAGIWKPAVDYTVPDLTGDYVVGNDPVLIDDASCEITNIAADNDDVGFTAKVTLGGGVQVNPTAAKGLKLTIVINVEGTYLSGAGISETKAAATHLATKTYNLAPTAATLGRDATTTLTFAEPTTAVSGNAYAITLVGTTGAGQSLAGGDTFNLIIANIIDTATTVEERYAKWVVTPVSYLIENEA